MSKFSMFAQAVHNITILFALHSTVWTAALNRVLNMVGGRCWARVTNMTTRRAQCIPHGGCLIPTYSILTTMPNFFTNFAIVPFKCRILRLMQANVDMALRHSNYNLPSSIYCRSISPVRPYVNYTVRMYFRSRHFSKETENVNKISNHCMLV